MDILLASVVLVIIIKTTIVTTVVKGFGYNSKTALLVTKLFPHFACDHVCFRVLYSSYIDAGGNITGSDRGVCFCTTKSRLQSSPHRGK